MIPKVHTTLMPIDSPDDPKPRAELGIYLGDAKVSTTLLELDESPACDKCGQLLELQVEHTVDQKGARHVGKCPKRVTTVEVPSEATDEEAKAAIEEAQASD